MPSGVYTRTKPRSLETRQKISRAFKGRTSPMKGRKQSIEARTKISNANKGRTPYKMTGAIKQKISETKRGERLSNEHRAKIAASMKRGSEHHNWRGGVSSITKIARSTPRYREWRQMVFDRDDYACRECGVKGVYLTAHHIKGQSMFPELRFELSNGLTLCEGCHMRTDNYKGRAKRLTLNIAGVQ